MGSFNGSGTYVRTINWTTEAASPPIEISKLDTEIDDLATALSTCIARDGQSTISAAIPFNSQRITGLGTATARTDAARLDQVQDNGPNVLGSVAGTDTITGSLTPAVSSYANGMEVWFEPAGNNTGATTLNINGVGAESVVALDGSTALAADELVSGVWAHVIYDLSNTNWVLQNTQSTSVPSHTHATSDITSGTFADGRIAASNVTQHQGSINHDSLSGFVSNEHINHGSVSVIAGTGLSGGGTIAATRTINLDVNSLTNNIGATGAVDLDVDTVAISNSTATEKATAAALITPEVPSTITGTSATLAESDFGKVLRYSSTSTITVTLPNGLKTGFWCVIQKTGASGTLNLSASTTLNTLGGFNSLTDQHGMVTVYHLGSNVWTASGNLT